VVDQPCLVRQGGEDAVRGGGEKTKEETPYGKGFKGGDAIRAKKRKEDAREFVFTIRGHNFYNSTVKRERGCWGDQKGLGWKEPNVLHFRGGGEPNRPFNREERGQKSPKKKKIEKR